MKTISAKDLDPNRIPRHVAIIMDGNGRWARRRGLPRIAGHRAGVKTVDRIVEAAVEAGVGALTLYTFSTENWQRPVTEISALMELLKQNLVSQRKKLQKNGVRLTISGDLSQFHPSILEELNETVSGTSHCDKLVLNLALGYSGRQEIIQAVRGIAGKVLNHELTVESIDDTVFSDHLYTAHLPDPELIIRTSGELRLSNFLLWQCSYSEFYFTDTLWPNFKKAEFFRALYDYQNRDRRFGGVKEENSSG